MNSVTEKRILPLTSDIVFKSFMISNENKEYKAHMLSVVTGIPYKKLLKAEYVSEEFVPEHDNSKVMRTDIIVKIGNERKILIEMNNKYYKGLENKTFSYASRIISTNLKTKQEYKDLNKFIEIEINNFSKYSKNKILREKKIVFQDNFEIANNIWTGYVIDLECLKKKCYTDDEEKIAYWFKLFDINSLPELRGNEVMDKAIKVLEDLSEDDYVLSYYDAEEEAAKRTRAIIATEVEEQVKKRLRKINKKELKERVDAEFKELVNAAVEERVSVELKERVDTEFKKLVNAEVEERVDAELKERVDAEVKERVDAEIDNAEKNNSIQIAKNLLNQNVDIKTVSKCTAIPISELKNLK